MPFRFNAELNNNTTEEFMIDNDMEIFALLSKIVPQGYTGNSIMSAIEEQAEEVKKLEKFALDLVEQVREGGNEMERLILENAELKKENEKLKNTKERYDELRPVMTNIQSNTEQVKYLKWEVAEIWKQNVYDEASSREKSRIRKAIINKEDFVLGCDGGANEISYENFHGMCDDLYNLVTDDSQGYAYEIVSWFHQERIWQTIMGREAYCPTSCLYEIGDVFIMMAIQTDTFKERLVEEIGINEEQFMGHEKYLPTIHTNILPLPALLVRLPALAKFQAICRGRAVRWQYPLAQLINIE